MKLISKRKLLGIFLVLMGTSPLVLALDNAHFYKPANFEGIRSHDTADWVNKTNLRLGYGSTRSGYNYKSNKTSLLDIYGNQNLLYLITNVPQKSGQAVTEHLTNLAKLSNHSQTNSDFGNLKFSGKFTLLEGNIDIRQNLVEGFFIEGHLPIRKVKVENISYDDLSPTTGRYSQTTGEWIQLKQQLNNLLNIYGLKNYETVYDKTGLGDLSFSIGWQYEDKTPLNSYNSYL